jgi:hypothetical protein
MERPPKAKNIFRIVPPQCDDDFVIFALYPGLGAARFYRRARVVSRFAGAAGVLWRSCSKNPAGVSGLDAIVFRLRHGAAFRGAAFTSPTLFAPDLELRLLGLAWHWLAWAEAGLGLTILFGIYVRLFAALLIVLALLGAGLFGEAILGYAGALIGAAIYLVMQGAGRHFLP